MDLAKYALSLRRHAMALLLMKAQCKDTYDRLSEYMMTFLQIEISQLNANV